MSTDSKASAQRPASRAPVKTLLGQSTLLDLAEVKDLEVWVDRQVENHALPSKRLGISTWAFLTAAEAFPRASLYLLVNGDLELTEALLRIGEIANKIGYGLKHALLRTAASRPLNAYVPKYHSWLTANAFFYSTAELDFYSMYETVVRGFTLYYEGLAQCWRDSKTKAISFRSADRKSLVFEALQDCLSGLPRVDPLKRVANSDGLAPWILGVPQDLVVEALPQLAGLEAFEKLTVKQIYDSFPGYYPLFPGDWSFPWASVVEVRSILRALSSYCTHHVFALGRYHAYIDASFDDFRAKVERQVIVVEQTQLAKDLSELSGVSLSKVTAFLQVLVYGYGVTSPDPVLQPLIPAGNGYLLLAPIQIAYANFERNVLSLHARIDPTTFDRSSQAFEREMTGTIRQFVSPRYMTFVTNVMIGGTEVDLVIADESSRTILVCELKRTIEPADVREIVRRRKKELPRKLEQLGIKVKAVNDRRIDVLSRCGISTNSVGNSPPWEICGVVVVDGYYGRPYPVDNAAKIVPQVVFEIGLAQCRDLHVLYRWLASESWLPMRGEHYEEGYFETLIGGMSFSLENVELKDRAVLYTEHVARSCHLANSRYAQTK